MRGQVSSLQSAVGGHRITPADAGTRTEEQWHIPWLPDHPRGCGDKFPEQDGRIWI